jgi:hypothetical protein
MARGIGLLVSVGILFFLLWDLLGTTAWSILLFDSLFSLASYFAITLTVVGRCDNVYDRQRADSETEYHDTKYLSTISSCLRCVDLSSGGSSMLLFHFWSFTVFTRRDPLVVHYSLVVHVFNAPDPLVVHYPLVIHYPLVVH